MIDFDWEWIEKGVPVLCVIWTTWAQLKTSKNLKKVEILETEQARLEKKVEVLKGCAIEAYSVIGAHHKLEAYQARREDVTVELFRTRIRAAAGIEGEDRVFYSPGTLVKLRRQVEGTSIEGMETVSSFSSVSEIESKS